LVNDGVRKRVEATFAAGDRFQDYVIDGAIGHGGSAVVYRATSVSAPDEVVALKVLDAQHLDPDHLHRMEREFDFADRVKHPHVVTMYGHGLGWLAMELVTGGTAGALTGRADKLTALAQIASALDNCHRVGVVHCDVKPSNILVAEDFSVGGALLIDFGVARSLTDHAGHHPTHVEASLPYAAPEVLRGQRPTPAVDEYALACTAVELLTGAPPFSAHTSWGLMDDQLNRPVPQFSRRYGWLPRAFDGILAKAMAKDPDLRYDTCGEFVDLVRDALASTVDDEPARDKGLIRTWRRRRRWADDLFGRDPRPDGRE
jgi:serine/threonine protein kinase